MKIVTSAVIFIASVVVTNLTVYIPINGIKLPNATYCGPPAGLPFAFTTNIWRLPPNTLTCQTMLPFRVVATAFMLDLIIWLIIVLFFSKLLVILRRRFMA